MGRGAGHKGYGETSYSKNPRGKQGPGCRPRAATEGQTNTVYGGKCRHAEWGWQVAGMGDVQVEGALFWERRWGVGVTERCGYDNRY